MKAIEKQSHITYFIKEAHSQLSGYESEFCNEDIMNQSYNDATSEHLTLIESIRTLEAIKYVFTCDKKCQLELTDEGWTVRLISEDKVCFLLEWYEKEVSNE